MKRCFPAFFASIALLRHEIAPPKILHESAGFFTFCQFSLHSYLKSNSLEINIFTASIYKWLKWWYNGGAKQIEYLIYGDIFAFMGILCLFCAYVNFMNLVKMQIPRINVC